MQTSQVIYVGPYYLPDVIEKRKLPSRNIAAFNRMQRIAEALTKSGVSVHIISPGVSMRCGFYKRIFHQTHNHNQGGIIITTIPSVGIPFGGMICEPLFLITWVLYYIFHNKPRCVLIYNYSPSFLILMLVLKLLGIRTIAQIEDIASPKLTDWKQSSETSLLQQIVHASCMRVIMKLANGIVIPTTRFQVVIPHGKPVLVVTGCMPFAENVNDPMCRLFLNDTVNILFVGAYQNEHGLDLLMDLISTLHREHNWARLFEFHCCGTTRYPEEFTTLSKECHNLPIVKLYGFLEDQEYNALLDLVDVALVLQRAKGRYASFKTPSKAYEFLALGKVVIATDVGDLSALAPDKIVCLRKETPDELLNILTCIVDNPNKYLSMGQEAFTYSRFEYSYDNIGKRLKSFILA